MKALLSKYRKPLMGLAAIFILVYHTYAKFLMCIPFLGEAEAFISRILFYGVDIFLLLSGLGMAYSLSMHSVAGFYINRAKRIFLPVVIICIVMALVDSWPFEIFLYRVSGRFVFENMYSFLWFYPAIILYYFLAPFLYAIIKRFKNKYLFAGLFFIAYVIAANVLNIQTGGQFEMWTGIFNRLPIFVLGICIGCDENERIPVFDVKKIIAVVAVLVAGGAMAWYTSIMEKKLLVPGANSFLPNICLSIATCILVCILLEKLDDTKVKENITKVLGFFGMISFELYLVQEWICKKLLAVYEPVGRHKSVIFDVMCWTIVTLAALLLHYVVEKFFSIFTAIKIGVRKHINEK